MTSLHLKAYDAALSWYQDHGVDDILDMEPPERFRPPASVADTLQALKNNISAPQQGAQTQMRAPNMSPNMSPDAPSIADQIRQTQNAQMQSGMRDAQPQASLSGSTTSGTHTLGAHDARMQAIELAKGAQSVEELNEIIANFGGLSLKKTATNMVFSDGNPKSRIMLIGDAPGADEDRQGKPFAGVGGQLLDRILNSIDLGRDKDGAQGVYLSNILNWRPPGNRSPNQAEIDVSLPFIEKHIMLVQPDILILCGGVPAKALLGRSESISRLRQSWHDYTPLTQELGYNSAPIPAIATYDPVYLLRTPAQKRAVWSDMLSIQARLSDKETST